MIFLIIFFLALIITWLYRKIAIKKSIIDIPNSRSSHTIPTPRGGGVAIVIAWFLGLLYLYTEEKIQQELFLALLSGIIIVITSLLDDIYNLKPKIRFGAQFLSAGLALYFLGGLQILDLGVFSIDNVWLLSPIAFLSIIWFVNLFNFLDGIDGYASMETIFLSLAMFYFTNANIFLILAFATLGFIVWNWQPAKIFMGDVGSTLLGFNLIILALYYQNIKESSLIIFVILSAVFWFDATLTLLRRWKNKEKLTQAHKKHAYQRIVRYGYSHQKTTIFAFIINILLFILAIASNYTKQYLIFLFVVVILGYFIFNIIDKKYSFK